LAYQKVIEAVILGLTQGLTEFLPVSSSGHLVLIQHIFGIKAPELFFDTALHLATMVATAIFFRKELGRILGSLFIRGGEGRRYTFMIILSLLPTAVIGLMVQKEFSYIFASLAVVRWALFATALILLLPVFFWIDSGKEITGPRAILIGVVQGIAVIPGLSRSGSTIMAGVISGMSFYDSFKFSFIISIPAIAGAMFLNVVKGNIHTTFPLGALLAGCGMAFVSGYVALVVLKRVVMKKKMHLFAYYLLALVAFTLLFLR